MTEKTIQEIKAEYGRKQTELLMSRQDAVDEIAAKGSEGVSHRDKLTYGQVQSIMLEEKTAAEEGNRTQTREALLAAHERYEAHLAKRADSLKPKLFGVEDAGALARAALASEEELSTMMDIAARAGSKELAKAAFVAAEHRGMGDVISRYFEIDGEARTLYHEWKELPTKEALKRQRENLNRLVRSPDPQQLMPPARVNV